MTGSSAAASASSAGAVRPHSDGFRLGNDVLAFRFVATLSERRGDPVERIPTPERLRAWLLANSLGKQDMPVSESLLKEARELREAIHRSGVAIADGGAPDPAAERLLNRWNARHRPPLELDGGVARWRLPDADPARAALAIVAFDAVATLGGHAGGVIKRCEQATCDGLFVDTSRGGRRRWCSMATCGNKVKKANLKRS
ncbi:putative RNA-binding Zn ribbon-like protein [Nonomuraea thailandensis]|uniref:RNA-binding Zn ribbon-like protein n=1 Tax=Nonomuraea thailandensis TaxID=1188745 RepID=A0A9X2GEP3_9ACTN|nr:CGNR zinc finger domain-containing protein [Nonomuraea thailandensis]MCP2357377.1 putative RNA-binding Zn ribbon-like protein [Nonomuraea thailandensis]